MKQKLMCETALKSRAREAQSGRSMVEMLGVLAIIGVLSIGGIAGYIQAMNRHKANEIVDALQKRAVVVSAGCLNQKIGTISHVSLAEFPETILGDTIRFSQEASCMHDVCHDSIIDIHWQIRDTMSADLCQALQSSPIAPATVCCGANMSAPLSEIDCTESHLTYYCDTSYLLDLTPFDWRTYQCGEMCAL